MKVVNVAVSALHRQAPTAQTAMVEMGVRGLR